MNKSYFRIASLYLLLGVGMGMVMAASENFALRPVHAHVNLLGWVSLALFGLFYTVYPHAAANKLARVQFWGYNIALPVQMLALALFVTGHAAVAPLLGISSVIVVLGVLCFVVNVWRYAGSSQK
ncbi:cytochrome-c oxidase [Duganella callida]|uniref:Cytochrome-c oxidase n=1 Tax=Duganella callida TaxID=2561932 RepID=A0A4Y9SCK8_9BURK|nr:cytochrome-c oxidase [Duganella callida]TFW18130.1 cytochrome-c oxidase [Duganella callida]